MFLIEIAGIKILYTGDYSREEDRHLMPAERPPGTVEVMICESTFGVQSHEPRVEREARFTSEHSFTAFAVLISPCGLLRFVLLAFPIRNGSRHCHAPRSLLDSHVCSWTCARAPAYPRRILVCSSRASPNSGLLCIRSSKEVHGSLPDLHQHDEYQGKATNCSRQQPVRFQTHQQPSRKRRI